MKNIIHKMKYIAVAVIALSLGSCDAILDDEITDFGTGPNLVGFPDTSLTIAAETDGQQHERLIPIQIIGPSVWDLNEEVTVNVMIEESSTAIEGVHYILDSNTVTLTPGEGEPTDVYQGGLPITILTEGLEAPLAETPVLDVTITEASSDANIVINDLTGSASVNIGYACPFDISSYEGTFIATTDEFGIYIESAEPFEVEAGPGENQITLVDFAAHPEGYDLIVDVDPETGDLTVPQQVALNYNNFGATQYGELSMAGEGYSQAANGSCIGEFGFTANYTVSAGTFGEYQLVFERVTDGDNGNPTDEGGDTGEGDEGDE